MIVGKSQRPLLVKERVFAQIQGVVRAHDASQVDSD